MATRIDLAQDHLAAKLTELRRREGQTQQALAPLRHLASPWLWIGLAVGVGYRLGRR